MEIDFAIVSVAIGLVYWVSYSATLYIEPHWHALTSVAFFAYWVILEYHTGQSLGKRLLCLRTTKVDGTNPSLLDCVVNSFGKAFLLPIDVILGWIFTDKHRQRIFNKISKTIVIKVQENDNEEIPYKLD